MTSLDRLTLCYTSTTTKHRPPLFPSIPTTALVVNLLCCCMVKQLTLSISACLPKLACSLKSTETSSRHHMLPARISTLCFNIPHIPKPNILAVSGFAVYLAFTSNQLPPPHPPCHQNSTVVEGGGVSTCIMSLPRPVTMRHSSALEATASTPTDMGRFATTSSSIVSSQREMENASAAGL